MFLPKYFIQSNTMNIIYCACLTINYLKLYSPDIESWIDWWHERQGHIFALFKRGGLPSQADKESKFRAQQEMEADEFVDILDDDYAIILEAIQAKL